MRRRLHFPLAALASALFVFTPVGIGGEPALAADGVLASRSVRHDEPEAPPGMVLVPRGHLSLGLTREALAGWFEKRGYRGKAKEFEAEIVEPAFRIQSLPAFFVDRTEVTHRQYEIFCTATGHQPPQHWTSGRIPEGREDHPVVLVSYDDAEAFAAWAGKRIPTEIEWERAARGDDERTWPWGDAFDDYEASGMKQPGAAKFNHANTAERGVAGTLPVGSFPSGASPAGCLDLCGNAAEWTASWFEPYRGTKGMLRHWGRVVRGGSFYQVSYSSRTTVRIPSEPNRTADGLGFRCVKSIERGRDSIASALARFEGQLPVASFDLADALALEHTEYDRKRGLVLSSESIATIPLHETRLHPEALLREGRQRPVLLGLLHLGVPITTPPTPPGDYALLFQTGDAKALAQWEKARAAEEAVSGSGDAARAARRARGDSKRDEPKGREGLPPFSREDRLFLRDRDGVIVSELPKPDVAIESDQTSKLVVNAARQSVDVVLAIPVGKSRSRLVVRATLGGVKADLTRWTP